MTTARQARELNQLLVYTQQQVPSFSPQCFLLEKAGDLKLAIDNNALAVSGPGNTSGGKKRVPVRQLGIDLDYGGSGDPSNLKYIQKITSMQKGNYEEYFKFTPADIAQMAHYMSVTEALTTKNGKTTEKPIMNTDANFHDITNSKGENTILRANAQRHGAGIESITADLVGIDSFTKKQVYLNAKFFFQDIKTMLSEPYAALFKLETSRDDPNEGKLFRTVDFHIGWNSNNKKIKQNIKKLNLSIRSHLVKYTFDVRQDGSIIADATYRGYYIEGFSGPQANLLEIAKTRFLEIKKRQDEIDRRATTVRNRNAANVAEAQRDLLIINTAQGVINQKFADREAAVTSTMGTPSPPGGQQFPDAAAVDTFLDDAKGESANKIAAIINSNSNLAKSVLSKADFALGPADRLNKLQTDLKDQTTVIGGVLNRVFQNLTSSAQIAAISPTAPTGGPKKLWDELNNNIAVIRNQNNVNVQTSQGNIKDAKKFAFDEQIRLASLARLKALQIIGQKLVSSRDIYYAKIPRDVVRNFKLGAASSHQSQIATALAQLGSASAYVSKSLTLSKDNFDKEEFQIIPFVFLGNLIENMLNIPARYSQTGEPDPNYTVYDLMKTVGTDVKIDLGLLSYNTPYTGTRVINLQLYYMPISLEELNNFFSREVLSKGKMNYSFNQFLNDLLKKFLSGIFSSCAKESNSKGLGIPKVETTIGDYPEKKKRTTQYFIHGAKETITDLLKSRINPSNFGKYKSNLRAHIPHFFVFGRTEGIEKSIKLTDIADETLKRAQYYSPRSSLTNDINGNSGLKHTGFIPAVFQTEIQTIGFPIMNIGQLIYVDLKPTISKNKAKSRPFDASGYYGVNKVSHNVTKDSFTTNITAILQISDKDSNIVKIGGLGGATGTLGGVTGGRFITTPSGQAGMNSVWNNASTPTPPPTTPPPTPAPSALIIGTGVVPDVSGIVVEWIKAMKEGYSKGFWSSEFDKIKATASSDITVALGEFLSPTRPNEKPKTRAYYQFGPNLDDYFSKAASGVSLTPSGRIPGFLNGKNIMASGGGFDRNGFLKDLGSKKFSPAAAKKAVDYIENLSPGDLAALGDLKDVPHFMLIREFTDGEIEVQFVEIAN